MMGEACRVSFSFLYRYTLQAVIFYFDNLLTQLQKKNKNAAIQDIALVQEKRKDLNVATEKIVVANDLQLQIKVSQKSIGIYYNELQETNKKRDLPLACFWK